MAKKKVLSLVLLLVIPIVYPANGEDERRLIAAAMTYVREELAPIAEVDEDYDEDYKEEDQFVVVPGGFHAPQNKAYDVVVGLVEDCLDGIVCTEEEVRMAVQLCLDERDWGMLAHLFKKCPWLQWFFIGGDDTGCAYNLLREMAARAGCLSVCVGIMAEFSVLHSIDRVRMHM